MNRAGRSPDPTGIRTYFLGFGGRSGEVFTAVAGRVDFLDRPLGEEVRALLDVGGAVGTGRPSRSSSVEDSSYQLSGARAPQNERHDGSVVLQRIGGRSGSPVK